MAIEYSSIEDNGFNNLEPVKLELPTTITNNSLLLSWSESKNNDFLRYEIHISNFKSFIPYSTTLYKELFEKTVASQKITNLEQNTTYFFKLRLYCDKNQYVDSNEVIGTTLNDGSSNINLQKKNEYNIFYWIFILLTLIFCIVGVGLLFWKKNRG